jgi:hypothetical protein
MGPGPDGQPTGFGGPKLSFDMDVAHPIFDFWGAVHLVLIASVCISATGRADGPA